MIQAMSMIGSQLSLISCRLSAVAMAQVDYAVRLKGLKSAFQPSESEPTEVGELLKFAGAIVTMAIAVLIVRAIWRRRADKRGSGKPYKLFAYALKQLGIRLPDRILLRIAAKSCGIRQPTVMLFSPGLLEQTAGRWADSIAITPIRKRARKRVDFLAGKAFS
ncbi:MAG: hypothetical protein JXQ75_12710 [Phycisphaerae bacterium]|nr:hypothetical protein [Phycisphaerae bacterium]